MGFMEFSGHFAGIYVAYVFNKDEVESYRMFREHCFLPCSPDFQLLCRGLKLQIYSEKKKKRILIALITIASKLFIK